MCSSSLESIQTILTKSSNTRDELIHAEETLNHLLNMEVYSADLYYALGILYFRKQYYILAIDCLKKALLTENKPNISVFIALSECYRQIDLIADARIYAEKALALEKKNPEVYVTMAAVLEKEGFYSAQVRFGLQI